MILLIPRLVKALTGKDYKSIAFLGGLPMIELSNGEFVALSTVDGMRFSSWDEAQSCYQDLKAPTDGMKGRWHDWGDDLNWAQEISVLFRGVHGVLPSGTPWFSFKRIDGKYCFVMPRVAIIYDREDDMIMDGGEGKCGTMLILDGEVAS